MAHYDVIIVGGGLAGLTAAIHLSKENHTVLVVEKKEYPHHKVCGEYVSNEIVPYLKTLGISLDQKEAVQINTLHLSTVNGRSVKTKLPLGGVGVSRYAFDYQLYRRGISLGASFLFENASSINFQDSVFEVITSKNKINTSSMVIGSYGKRSNLDKQLNRDFINQKSSWLGVKAHYQYDAFPDNLVALHNFKGGYGGLSKTETGAVNFCYLASYESFQKEKDVKSFNENIVASNPFLNSFLEKATPIFEEALTIAQISFHEKKAIANHIVMCGDTAGLIHPLCGNGMAMAIHSAKIASEGIHKYLTDKNYSRSQFEKEYEKQWHKAFSQRLWMGRQLQSLLLNERLLNRAIGIATRSPLVLRRLIKSTHGKPIKC